MVGWVVPKTSLIIKISIWLDLEGLFSTTCARPLQKVQIWLMGVELTVIICIIEIIWRELCFS